MKLKSALFLLLAGAAFLFQGCDKCTESGEVNFDPSMQFLSVTYETPNGVNYIDSLYNQNNITVLLNTNGGKGQAKSITASEDLSDGMFGPYPFSTTAPFGSNELPTFGVPYDYVYYINKDTFGSDTFRVKFVAAVDECKEFWQQLEYYRNGDPLTSYFDQESASIVIVE